MSEDIGTSSCSTSPDDGGGGVGSTVVGGTPGGSSAGGLGSTSLQEDSSEQPPREPTPASFSASSRDYSSGRDGGNTTTTGTPGTASSSGRHSSLSHGGRSSSHLALAHTPPLEAPALPHRPDTPLSATAPQTSYLAHTPPNEGSRSPFSLAGLHAALPSSSSALGGGIIHPQPMGIGPSHGSSSTSLTMIGNPLHNPGASYSRYSSGVVTPHESVGYEASNEPSLYSGGGSYGYSRIDSKLHGDDFDYMDDDPGLPRPGSGGVLGAINSGSYPGLYGGRGPVPSSLLYRSESVSSATDSPSNQPEQIYEDDSIFDQPPPPPAPAPISKHGRDKSGGSGSKKNKFFKNYYDKASLNQLISSSAKVSNRDISVNRLCGGYGGDGDPTYAGAGLTEMLEDPVEEEGGERVVWEYHNVTLTRVPGYGFGIAVSGGRDNPHFRNGDPSIAISDVLKAGPAEGKLEVNDRLISANGVSLEGVEYARAVQVLRDSGASVQLMVRRRVVLPSASPQTLTVTLTRTRKKEEYGVVLGCRLYIKEVVRGGLAARNGALREGDELLRINTSSTDDLSLKEARKMLESQKEQLQLVVRRHAQPSPSALKELCDPGGVGGVGGYAAQNLYVQPPSRPSEPPGGGHYPPGTMLHHDKNNLNRYPGVSSDFPYGSVGDGGGVSSPTDSGAAALPPRPPLPRPEDYYAPPPPAPGGPRASTSPELQDGSAGLSPTKSQGPVPEPRFVSFRKEGSAGIRLTGGNEVGIFVTAVQAASQAQLQGIVPGDKVLKVNEMELSSVTREEAVLYLMSLQDQIELIVQTRLHDYQQILASQKGDLFYIKTHFHYEPEGSGELSFRSGDVFRVVDTLHGGVVGAWQVERIGRNNQETQRGTIPNKARAEELATAQFNQAKKEQTQSESRSGFFRRRRNSRRSKSLGKDHWEDVVFGDSMSKFPAYERVSLQHPGFVRPVVLFGPLADVARTKLLADNPDHFSSPQLDSQGEKQQASIIRLSAIREIVERGKHALLDITPSAVDRLNYAQFCPIVIYLRVDSKQAVKEMRAGFPNLLCSRGRQSSKKLFEQSLKVERLWGHVFTSTLTLTQPDTWPRKLVQAIAQHQAQPVWMAQNKPSEALSDDFLFPMTSRLSYASSPESDMEGGSDPHTPSRTPHRLSSPSSPHTQTPEATGPPYPSSSHSRSRMVKSSSDPSIAAPEDLQSGSSGGYNGPNMGGAPPPYSASPPRKPRPVDPPPPQATDDRRKSHGGDSKYGFGGTTSDSYSGGQRGGTGPGVLQQDSRSGVGTSSSPYAIPPPNGGAPSSSHGGSPPSSITYGYGSQQPSSMNSVASSSANVLLQSPHRPQPPNTNNNNNINNGNGPSPPNGAGPHHPHFNHHSRLPPPPPNNQTNGNSNSIGISSNLNNTNAIPAATSTPSTNNNPRFPHSPPPHNIISNNNNNCNPSGGGHPSLPPPNHNPNLPPGYSPTKPTHLTMNGHGPKAVHPPGSHNGLKSPPKDPSNAAPPPRIDRSNKPGKPRSGEFGGAEYDANYINTGRGGPSDQHRKVGYGEPGIGPNAHDDLKSRYNHPPQHPYGGGPFPPPPLPGGHPMPPHPGSHHHRSAEAHSQRYPRSASQPPAFHGEDPYGINPVPPPKSGPPKPVPPPKPRQYRGGGGGWPSEKPSRAAGSSSAPNGRLSDDYSAIDSGHGSSLERKCDTFGRGSYPKQSPGSQGYYLNVPMPRGADTGGGGGRGDLPNHDHRGSAFELYKKPADPRARPPPQQPQQFYAGEPQGNR